MLEDVGHTHNINMHTFDTFAVSFEEAIGKMIINRPDLQVKNINYIRNTETNEMLVKEEKEYKKTTHEAHWKKLLACLEKN